MNFEVYDFIMQLFPYHGKVVVGTTYFVGCFCISLLCRRIEHNHRARPGSARRFSHHCI